MAKISIWNIGAANAALNSAHESANKALAAAKITSLQVDGKDVPASEAPLNVKIEAVSALISAGDKTQDVSELIASNGQIAAQVDDLTKKNQVLEATQASHVQKITKLESDLTVANGSVTTLTAKNTELTNLLEASNKEAARVSGAHLAFNKTLSEFCVTADCLVLNDSEGKPLAKDAKKEDKVAAAEKIPADAKLTSLFGAVNAAVAKTGTSFAALPAAAPNQASAEAKPLSPTELCAAAVAAKAAGKPAPAFKPASK